VTSVCDIQLVKRWRAFGLRLDFSVVRAIKASCVALGKHAMRLALKPSRAFRSKQQELRKHAEERRNLLLLKGVRRADDDPVRSSVSGGDGGDSVGSLAQWEQEREKDKAAMGAARAKVVGALDSAIHFAFRCHQFAGGFDAEASSLFDELHTMLDLMQEEAGGDNNESQLSGSQV
jgi:hypothetical protein